MLNYHSQRRRAKTGEQKRTKGKQSMKRSRSLRNSVEDEEDESSTSIRGEEAEVEAAKGAQLDDIEGNEKRSSEVQAIEAARMLNIWTKPVDVIGAQKVAEEDLSDFLDDMFM
uniref:Apoptosis-antagonizing transcription factor C-terminal domain-containing protein n=1 Tax=Ascaris lumbricoides TaxID=6252 RepID=A0A0M3HF03_ASCLU